MKNKTVDNMIKTGEVLHLYKVLSAGATLTSLLLGLILLLSPTDDTVVVIKEKNKKTYLSGRRIPVETTDEDVKAFVHAFIEARYNWEDFHPKSIVKNVSCLGTKGFQGRLSKLLGNKKGEGVEQYVSFINVQLRDKDSTASFDRIIRLKGIPVVTPSGATLKIVRGKRTICNPHGLYVNGLTEHEGL